MMERTFETQAEAREAIKEYFSERNAARGQYPESLQPTRRFIDLYEDGSVEFVYIYKDETVLMRCECYAITVTFPE